MPLDFESLPLKELRKGRELSWDPHAIDLSQDAKDWPTLTDGEREVLLRMAIGFLVGERAVAHDLAPLQQALRLERGHMEEEMYITQQLFEESAHVEFFQRWLFDVLPGDLGTDIPFPKGPPSPAFADMLPKAMGALRDDQSPAAQMRAVVAYHQIVEGVLAEVGYHIFYQCLDARGILPGLRTGVRNIQVDESRHIAFGTYLAQRIIRDYPDMEQLFRDEMDKQLSVVLISNAMLFDAFGEPTPFGLRRDEIEKLTRELHRRRVEAVLTGGLVGA